MGFKPVADLDCDVAYALGGKNKETGKSNPTTAEGYYIGCKVTEGKYGQGKLYILQTSKGNVGIFGKTNLDQKMASVTPGTMVRISLNGTVPTNKGNDMIKFKVEVDTDNTIDDTAPETTAFSAHGEDEELAESDVQDDEPEAMPPAARAPARAAETPSSPQQKKVQELLGRTRKGAAA